MRDDGNASKRRLDWSWKKGALTLSALGDPTSATDYALCVYDAGGRVTATTARAGEGWQALGAKGFRLKSASGEPGVSSQARSSRAPRAACS